jgi:hypothetical protein
MHLIPIISLTDMIMIIFIINNFLCKYDYNLILSSISIIVNKFDNIFNTNETYFSWAKISFPGHFATELAPSTRGKQKLLTV